MSDGPGDVPETTHRFGVPAIIGTLSFAGTVAALMQTLIIPVAPELPHLLGVSVSDASWAITATLLSAAVATPLAGRMGDMWGRRRVLLACLLILVAGSTIAALSTTLIPLIIGRALQGLAGGVIPLGISIMRDVLPPRKLAFAASAMSASLGVGSALGLPLSALIAQYFSWHVLFWTSAGLALAAAVLVLAVVPDRDSASGGRLDVVGAVGLSAGLVCVLLPISKGADWGWTSPVTLGLAAASVCVFVVWAWWELRARGPLVDLRLNARPQVLITNIASVIFAFALFASSLVFPQLMQLPESTGYGLGQSLIVVGLAMAPFGLTMMSMAPVSAWVTSTRGPKTTLVLGAGVVAVGYLVGTVLMAEIWQLVAVSVIIGCGVGLAYGAMPSLIMAAVPPAETGSANGLNTLMRSFGTSVASAVTGAVMTQFSAPFGDGRIPTEGAFRLSLMIAAVGALVAMVVATFIPSTPATGAAGGEPQLEPQPPRTTRGVAVVD